MGTSKGYPSRDFDSLNCAICNKYIYDRLGFVSKRTTYYDSINKKPIAVCEGKCRKEFIRNRQKEINKKQRQNGLNKLLGNS